MNLNAHEELKAKIWEIANRLRGPYRPPQYRLVMLPLVVLRRLDCVLEPTKDAVLKQHEKLLAKDTPEKAMHKLLGKAADPARAHPLYNTSSYTFAPGKTRTFVLDFVNKEEDIHKAFKPYYESTPVGENADPHQLSALQRRLLAPAIFTPPMSMRSLRPDTARAESIPPATTSR